MFYSKGVTILSVVFVMLDTYQDIINMSIDFIVISVFLWIDANCLETAYVQMFYF